MIDAVLVKDNRLNYEKISVSQHIKNDVDIHAENSFLRRIHVGIPRKNVTACLADGQRDVTTSCRPVRRF